MSSPVRIVLHRAEAEIPANPEDKLQVLSERLFS